MAGSRTPSQAATWELIAGVSGVLSQLGVSSDDINTLGSVPAAAKSQLDDLQQGVKQGVDLLQSKGNQASGRGNCYPLLCTACLCCSSWRASFCEVTLWRLAFVEAAERAACSGLGYPWAGIAYTARAEASQSGFCSLPRAAR